MDIAYWNSLPAAEIRRLARKSVILCPGYVHDALERYDEARSMRSASGTPTVAVMGHGNSGKDTVVRMLSGLTKLQPAPSTSAMCAPLVAAIVGEDKDTVWNLRRETRRFWYEFINGLREDDASLALRMCLGCGDVVAGVRSIQEFDVSLSQDVFQYVVWVNRMGIQPDPTLEFDAGYVIRQIPPNKLLWIDNNREEFHLETEVQNELFRKMPEFCNT